VRTPFLAFRWGTDKPLREQDLLTVSINGIESYSWTSKPEKPRLKEIPMPGLKLPSGIVDITWKFTRPFIADKKQITDPAIITLEVSPSELMIKP
jgi:hypothetical protein